MCLKAEYMISFNKVKRFNQQACPSNKTMEQTKIWFKREQVKKSK
jgi:hypothetical protein